MSNHDTDKVFTGSIPELYEAHLVPLIFEPYAVGCRRQNPGTHNQYRDESKTKDIIEHKPPWLPRYEQRHLEAIVGMEIKIREVQGKFKLSQNRSAVDRAVVVAKLKATGSESDSALARLMARE